MIETIKQIRLQIDGLAQLAGELGNQYLSLGPIGIYRVNAHTSLLMSKAWLGKILGLLGEKTPYKNDGSRNSERELTYKEYVDLNKVGEFVIAPKGFKLPPFDKSYIIGTDPYNNETARN